jgi:hypothetical protein
LGVRWSGYEEEEVEAVQSWGNEEEVDEGKEEEGDEGDEEAQNLSFPSSTDYVASGWGESSATGEWGSLRQSQSDERKEGGKGREEYEAKAGAGTADGEAAKESHGRTETSAVSGWGDDEW